MKHEKHQEEQQMNEGKSSFNPICFRCGKNGNIRLKCPHNQKKKNHKNSRNPKKEAKNAYISWDINDMDSLDDEEANICFMMYHEENEVTFHFPHNDLFHICKNLNKKQVS